MKTHRMYRKGREETPNILVLKPGVNYVPAKYFESLEAASAGAMRRLMFGTWVDEPSKCYVFNEFDQYGNPVSEILHVPVLRNADELPIESEHSYSVVGDDPYKSPEQVSHE